MDRNPRRMNTRTPRPWGKEEQQKEAMKEKKGQTDPVGKSKKIVKEEKP